MFESKAVVIAADTLLAALGLFLFRKLIKRIIAQRHLPLPPGPPKKPLIGNLLDVPTGRSWLAWAAHTRFGPLSHLDIFGTHIIALHDPQAAQTLFEKRSAVFSDRPRIVFGGEMCGWENTLALQRYGDHFRLFRKEIHQVWTDSALAVLLMSCVSVVPYQLYSCLLLVPSSPPQEKTQSYIIGLSSEEK